ncbi:TonB-dependent siderophore receptor [Lampropedia puyangensis]|uniref:TonB-dependent siderophore receptor n=2 Tax=Lampropedia puyangensis TaxID=1330072 RepID=A0A4S8F7I1_9BURK|nr:TonB-dependent siderophore receptor [Lampropedia puyangensis]
MGISVLGLSLVPAAAQAQSNSSAPANQATSAQHYSIPASSLSEALRAFASAAGVELTVDGTLVAGKQSSGLNNSYSVAEGFAALLGRHNLQAVRQTNGSYVVVGRSVSTQDRSADSHTLPTVEVTASTLGVSTDGTGSYAARAVSIGKGEQALKDIPQSVSVVTRQLMDEQNATSVYDALESTTGITLLQSPQGGKYIYSRGFDITMLQYDGVNVQRLYGRSSNYNGGTAIYDRAEILRGSAGLLQGGGDPGGAINLARKRPLRQGGVNATAKAGSWDRYGAQVDGSAALNADGSLRARAVIDTDRGHSFIDQVNHRNNTLYGTVEYDLSTQTQASIGASYETFKGRPFISGLPRYNNGTDIDLPRSTFLGAAWNRQDNATKTVYADLSHQFNDQWRAKVSAIHVQEDLFLKYAASQRTIVPGSTQGGTVSLMTDASQKAWGIDANVTGAFEVLGRQHEVVLGTSYNHTRVNTDYSSKTPFVPIDVFAPDPYRAEPGDDEIRYANTENRLATTRQIGAYGALRLQLSEPLKLVLGGRMGSYKTIWDTTVTTAGVANPSSTLQDNNRFMPFAGVIYALNTDWSAYASYADIFNPQWSLDAAGNNLKPIRGSTYEMGVKGQLWGGRANTSFALYRVDQKNRATEDIASGPDCRDGYYCYSDDGRVRSQGFDAEISGELTRGWNVFAGYTFNRNTYERDINNEGLDFNTYTPKHLLRVWTTYRLPGALNAFTVGGGVDTQSASYRKIGAVRINAPGRAVWNSYVRYQVNDQWQLALNFNNMFDKRYYTSIGNLVNSSHYGDPRNVMLSLRASF